MNLEQGKLEADVLDPVGQQMTDGFTAIITGADKAAIADLLPLAIEGRRLSLMARLDVNKRLGRHDEAAAKSAAQTFETLRQTLAQIDASNQGHGGERSGSSRDETDRYLSDSLHACRQPGCRSARTGEWRHEAGGRGVGRGRRQGEGQQPRRSGRDREGSAISHRQRRIAGHMAGARRLGCGCGARLADRPRHLAPGGRHVRGNARARRGRQDGRDPRRRPQGRDRPDGRHRRRCSRTT